MYCNVIYFTVRIFWKGIILHHMHTTPRVCVVRGFDHDIHMHACDVRIYACIDEWESESTGENGVPGHPHHHQNGASWLS